MRIAVPYENGQIFQHYGKTGTFKFYEVEQGQILTSFEMGPGAEGHEGITDFLKTAKTDVVICGRCGADAQKAILSAGMMLYAGKEGPADDTVRSFADGTLEYVPNMVCSHGCTGCGHHDPGGTAQEESCEACCG